MTNEEQVAKDQGYDEGYADGIAESMPRLDDYRDAFSYVYMRLVDITKLLNDVIAVMPKRESTPNETIRRT